MFKFENLNDPQVISSECFTSISSVLNYLIIV